MNQYIVTVLCSLLASGNLQEVNNANDRYFSQDVSIFPVVENQTWPVQSYQSFQSNYHGKAQRNMKANPCERQSSVSEVSSQEGKALSLEEPVNNQLVPSAYRRSSVSQIFKRPLTLIVSSRHRPEILNDEESDRLLKDKFLNILRSQPQVPENELTPTYKTKPQVTRDDGPNTWRNEHQVTKDEESQIFIIRPQVLRNGESNNIQRTSLKESANLKTSTLNIDEKNVLYDKDSLISISVEDITGEIDPVTLAPVLEAGRDEKYVTVNSKSLINNKVHCADKSLSRLSKVSGEPRRRVLLTNNNGEGNKEISATIRNGILPPNSSNQENTLEFIEKKVLRANDNIEEMDNQNQYEYSKLVSTPADGKSVQRAGKVQFILGPNTNAIKDPTKGEGISSMKKTTLMMMDYDRVCYACSSANSPTCLLPDRRTEVKYCRKGNNACVTKTFGSGSTLTLIRDCGRTCDDSEIPGLFPKHKSCGICYSDLCNSAFTININNLILVLPTLLIIVLVKPLLAF